MCYRFLEKYSHIKNPGFVTFLIAINPFLIYYAFEIRVYSLMVFLSVALIFLMYNIYLYDNPSKNYRLIFILVSIISLHTHYYMGFLLVAMGVNVLVYKGWNKFKLYLVDMILPILSLSLVIPFLGAISRQIGNGGNHISLRTMLSYLKYKIIFAYVFSLDAYLLRIISNYELWIFVILFNFNIPFFNKRAF